jgi:hypothetical protein
LIRAKDTASIIHGRIVSYNNVFSKENQFTKPVLEDLARFCRANETSFHADPRIHAVLEGRREVWLRIQEYLNLSPDEIMALHKIKNVTRSE